MTMTLPALREQQGLALPLTLFVLVILALLTAAVAGVTTTQADSDRLVDWDRKALYAAEAGLEDQIYALKKNKAAGAVGTVSLNPNLQYSVTLQCKPELSAGAICSQNRPLRTWEITSTGKVLNGTTVVHSRAVRALVEIRYGGADYGTVQSVSVLRWEFR